MLAALALTFALQADTVRLPAADYLERVLSAGPDVAAAALRAEAAGHAARQAGAWTNPLLAVSADNIGAQTETTGIQGARGVEGQAVLSFRLPLGGDRGASRDRGRAQADAATAFAAVTGLRSAAGAAETVARAERDRRLAMYAREELDALLALADALGAQATAGRASDADAARARLAVSVAREAGAIQAAAAAGSAVEVALRAGLDPAAGVVVTAGTCTPPPAGPPPGSPRLDLADARIRVAEGDEAIARGLRIPDVHPQIGVRRAMGVEALYAGLSFDLPLFDRGGGRVAAARGEVDAARVDAEDARRRVDAERATARAMFDALNEAGDAFRAEGFENDLARVVESAQARLDLGEGTLTELLDVRRARLRALEARERWTAEWRSARALLSELQGRTPTSDLFCDPLIREDR